MPAPTPVPQVTFYVDGNAITVDDQADFSTISLTVAEITVDPITNYVKYNTKQMYFGGSIVEGSDVPYFGAIYTTIIDLNGTKWLLNEIINLPLIAYNVSVPYDPDIPSYASEEEGLYCRLSFTSNGTNFIGFLDEDNIPLDPDEGDYSTVYYGLDVDGWTDEAYRTIEITGGTDATNTNLINWLQANATQIVEPTPSNPGTFIGNSSIEKILLGNKYVLSMFLDNIKIYEASYEVSLISFSIGDENYQAEDGMTWEEWVISEYNTNGYVSYGDMIMESQYVGQVGYYTGEYDRWFNGVYPTDVIASNINYYRHAVSGGSND